ncbi:MAG: TetR/AcrR family transcriptional regulator [Solirubrobacteraceae bacterium]|nr:TetR/AcrR family transcriptional regulator [Solirubrobacteraceae bacterium]
MSVPAEPRPRKRSEARERLLSTASELFYAEGIGGVGINRIVSASNVTLATLYRHFPSKQDLVIAYLETVHDAIAARTAGLIEHRRGSELVRTLGDEVTAEVARPGFRGCAFINAASEFEDAHHPVRRIVADHRGWYLELVRDGFAQAGHGRPGNAARHFLMLRDGAMTAGALDGTTIAQRTFRRGVEGLLRSIEIDPVDDHEDAD